MLIDAGERFALGPSGDTDRYVVDQPIDLGGEGIVYRCHRHGELRAVKVRRRAQSPAERERRTLIERLADAHVPGLVEVHERFIGPPIHPAGSDVGDATNDYLVMEWIEGRTLTAAAEEGVSISAILRALRPVCEALDRLRSGALTGGRSVIHGDVKPDNIMIRADGSGVLVDLGLLRPVDTEIVGAGTTGYSLGHDVPAGRADLYGLAGVVHHAYTGTPPPTDPAILDARLESSGCPPEVRRRIVEARTARCGVGARRWLAGVEGSSQPTPRPQRAIWPALLLAACGLVLSGSSIGTATGPSCEPELWAGEAELWRSTVETPVGWNDADRDCLHDAYEINAVGSDPNSPEGVGLWLRPANDQLAYLAGVHQLLNSQLWLDPAVCDPELWQMAAAEWRMTHENSPRWDDPDRDCLATVHEELLGTDPTNADSDADGRIDSLDADTSNGLIDPIDVQLSLAGPVAVLPAGQPPRLDRPRSDGPGD